MNAQELVQYYIARNNQTPPYRPQSMLLPPPEAPQEFQKRTSYQQPADSPNSLNVGIPLYRAGADTVEGAAAGGVTPSAGGMGAEAGASGSGAAIAPVAATAAVLAGSYYLAKSKKYQDFMKENPAVRALAPAWTAGEDVMKKLFG